MHAQKLSLRQFFSTLRTHVSAEEARQAAEHAAQKFLKTMPLASDDVIAGYYPIRQELDPRPLLTCLADTSHLIALPCIEGQDSLVFRHWKQSEALVRHPIYPVMQPSSNSPVCHPSIILVPLLAFDAEGNRLGYGGGFYDRTLLEMRRRFPALRAVGYGYDFQYTPTILPQEGHDQKLSHAITDKQGFTFL